MTRARWMLIVVVLVTPLLGGSAAARDGSQGYLIGTKAPLTASQVDKLKAAGAQVTHTYRTFGGAAAVMSSKAVKRVRALPFVTSVNRDSVKQLHAVAAADASDLPGTPYWLDLIDAEQNTTYDGSDVWVAVLDSGFYPNWRDYFDPASIITEHARVRRRERAAERQPVGPRQRPPWHGGISHDRRSSLG